jgi:hypothetical protein
MIKLGCYFCKNCCSFSVKWFNLFLLLQDNENLDISCAMIMLVLAVSYKLNGWVQPWLRDFWISGRNIRMPKFTSETGLSLLKCWAKCHVASLLWDTDGSGVLDSSSERRKVKLWSWNLIWFPWRHASCTPWESSLRWQAHSVSLISASCTAIQRCNCWQTARTLLCSSSFHQTLS